jgi:hypothetical protein
VKCKNAMVVRSLMMKKARERCDIGEKRKKKPR